jgi:hypothetical protein
LLLEDVKDESSVHYEATEGPVIVQRDGVQVEYASLVTNAEKKETRVPEYSQEKKMGGPKQCIKGEEREEGE